MSQAVSLSELFKSMGHDRSNRPGVMPPSPPPPVEAPKVSITPSNPPITPIQPIAPKQGGCGCWGNK